MIKKNQITKYRGTKKVKSRVIEKQRGTYKAIKKETFTRRYVVVKLTKVLKKERERGKIT
jgi:hypothetical protein